LLTDSRRQNVLSLLPFRGGSLVIYLLFPALPPSLGPPALPASPYLPPGLAALLFPPIVLGVAGSSLSYLLLAVFLLHITGGLLIKGLEAGFTLHLAGVAFTAVKWE
jgi:hypothetical protein